MDEQELAKIERRWTGRWVDHLQPETIADCLADGVRDVHALVAEVRRLQELIPWCPRGEGEHLLDDTFSGWCSTCGDTVT